MDLLVNNGSLNVKLSSKNILTTDIDESMPSLTPNTLSFKGRNGKLSFGSDYDEKKLTYTGYLTATSQSDYETKRNQLYQLFNSTNPFYITPIYSDDEMYGFERPGQTKGDKIGQSGGSESIKRFYVILEDTFQPEFQGLIGGKQLYKLSINFVTAVLPFGESKPKTATITDKIAYQGTVPASQLEVPFYVQFKADEVATNLTLKIGNRTWTYRGPVAVGDTFKIGGVYNLKNSLNVNDDTNAEYFVLDPFNGNSVTCSVKGTIEIHNYKELYL
ncbi:phage tail domain-containing protein [Weissella sagaensis]|uniref:phage tail domain-containing protein n=1 Tax=Weissella sagaensis TaxID=2559928 RepID=UPI0013EB6EDE|nr:phage tail domain-containing protein [Weissella sagaensis]